MFRTRPGILLVLALLSCACSLGGSARAAYTIGAAGPWQLEQGRNARLGIELARREINDAGGVNGHTLLIREVDDGADGASASGSARKFVDDRTVSAVVGHATAAAIAAAARVYDGQLAAVATAAGAPDLAGIPAWVFRLMPGDSAEGAGLARFAQRSAHKRAAILYENNPRGRALADGFRGNFRGEFVAYDPIRADAWKREVFVSYLRLRQPDIVFIAGLAGSALPLLAEASRQELKADVIGGDGWAGVVARADVSAGAYVGAPFVPSDPRPEVQKFVAAFRAANRGAQPDANAALGYDATKLVAAALAAVGPDRRKIRDWLAALPAPFAGVTGPIRFLPTGEPAGSRVVMSRVRSDGTLVVEAAPK